MYRVGQHAGGTLLGGILQCRWPALTSWVGSSTLGTLWAASTRDAALVGLEDTFSFKQLAQQVPWSSASGLAHLRLGEAGSWRAMNF